MSTGTGDGETLAALIESSTAMLAIDSGPGHVAGATATPTLIVWRGHHPLNYFSLAPNVRHALPVDHRALLLGGHDEAVTFFERHYEHRLYADLRAALPKMFDELLDNALGGQGELAVDGDLWVRHRHRNADRTIVGDVYVEDCYGVDRLPWQPQYVVDVGAHIGAFACRIERRLAAGGRVVCVEADRRNLPALERNVARFAKIVPAACTYLPAPVRLRTTVLDGTNNTGGSTIGAAGEIVPRVTLEEIMVAHEFPWVDVLKLDCEGSELSILANSRSLDRVRLVIGEWHDRELFLELIAQRFGDWRMRILRDGPLGLFWLENPRVEISGPPGQAEVTTTR
jgi:FkbM family methyltransferase